MQGTNFDSVLPEEFTVNVGGEPCNVTSVNDTVITCIPPLSLLGSQTVMVRNIWHILLHNS